MPRQLPSPTQLSPPPQDFASLQAPPLPRCLRAEPKINGCLSDASLDKPRFPLKAQVLQIAPPPPLLAHLCSLALAPFCSLTLAGAVLRESNAPTAATSARVNDTTSCGDGSPEWRMSFSLARPLSSTQLKVAASRSHVFSAAACRCRLRPGTPQAKRRTRS